MLTVFVSDAVVTAVILNTTFIRALTSLARANTAVGRPKLACNKYKYHIYLSKVYAAFVQIYLSAHNTHTALYQEVSLVAEIAVIRSD